MGFIGGAFGYRMLKVMGRRTSSRSGDADLPVRPDRLLACFGPGLRELVAGQRVLDFGCGEGNEALEAVRLGAATVLGVDIRPSVLEIGRRRAEADGFADRCRFSTDPDGEFDVVLSVDAFEHFADPRGVLETISRHTVSGGRVLISFGPTWYHPLGGHLFSVFPWSHLLFTEAAQIRWRADFKSDGATRFSEVEGGLNQMTIRRFERLVCDCGLVVHRLECVPIRRLRWIAGGITREFTTAVVRAELAKQQGI